MNRPTASESPRLAIIIPACDEEACLGRVLDELLKAIDPEKFAVVVGVNGSSDRTAQIAQSFPVLVAETPERGYGYGCQSAIDLAAATLPRLQAYLFFAGDGASDPHDVRRLVAAYEQGYTLVLGTRTGTLSNWRLMTFSHVIANFALGLWCGLLTGRWFTDLAPLRLVERELFEAIGAREMTFGWTIEAQVAAAQMGAAMCAVPARERARLAGQQKVSGVTWRKTFSVGWKILAAGYHARLRYGKRAPEFSRRRETDLLPQPQPGR